MLACKMCALLMQIVNHGFFSQQAETNSQDPLHCLVAKEASDRKLPRVPLECTHLLRMLLWLEAICCLPVAVRPSASEKWRPAATVHSAVLILGSFLGGPRHATRRRSRRLQLVESRSSKCSLQLVALQT